MLCFEGKAKVKGTSAEQNQPLSDILPNSGNQDFDTPAQVKIVLKLRFASRSEPAIQLTLNLGPEIVLVKHY